MESFEQRLEYVKKSLDTVKELVEKEGTLEPDTQLSVELYVDQLETYLENSKYNSHFSCVNRLEGEAQRGREAQRGAKRRVRIV